MRLAGVVCGILSFLGSCGSSAASEFSWCATEFPLDVTIPPSQDSVEVRVVFIAFPGDDASLPNWATDLETDLPAFIENMAGGDLVGGEVVPLHTMNLSVVLRPEPASDSAWVAPHPLSYYLSAEGTIGELNSAVLTSIAETYDPENYWAGVNVVCIIYYGCHLSYPDCAMYYASTGLSLEDPVPGMAQGTTGTRQQMWVEPKEEQQEEQEATLAHEYLHLVGFGHPPGKFAGVQYGRYDLQAGGQDGYAELADGLIPVHPYGLTINTIGGGWALTPTPIDVSTLDLRIPDFFGEPLRSERKMFEIAMSSPPAPSGTVQSFLLVNHQGTTPHDAKYLETGLLVWHLLNPDQLFGARDLELASGKFVDGQPDSDFGCDAMEATTPPDEYVGSATDFFDGVTAIDFSYFTNPNSNLFPSTTYSCVQTVPSEFAVENMRRDAESGDMLVDVYLTRAQLIEAPNGGESIERGSTVAVTWRARPVVGYQEVDVAISDDGVSYRTIQSGLPANTGSYDWLVLQKAGTYKLRLVSRDSTGNTWSDESDAFFTVTDSRVCAP